MINRYVKNYSSNRGGGTYTLHCTRTYLMAVFILSRLSLIGYGIPRGLRSLYFSVMFTKRFACHPRRLTDEGFNFWYVLFIVSRSLDDRLVSIFGQIKKSN